MGNTHSNTGRGDEPTHVIRDIGDGDTKREHRPVSPVLTEGEAEASNRKSTINPAPESSYSYSSSSSSSSSLYVKRYSYFGHFAWLFCSGNFYQIPAMGAIRSTVQVMKLMICVCWWSVLFKVLKVLLWTVYLFWNFKIYILYCVLYVHVIPFHKQTVHDCDKLYCYLSTVYNMHNM